MSTNAPRLWIPGPTHVRPAVLAACARPTIGHRGQGMKDLVRSIDGRLKALFGTKQHALVLTASGSAAWEAAIRCGVRERMGAVANGAFSERFASTGSDCQKAVETLTLPWGAGIDPQVVAAFVRERGPFDALAFVQNETSTGAFSDVPAIAHAVRSVAPETLLLVDCVSSLAGTPFAFDAWGIDLALASSQKCLALPPGIAAVAMSDRFLERARAVPGRGYYLDLVRAQADWAKDQTPATPAVNLFYALDEQLRAFDQETLDARFARHLAMAELTHRWSEERGFPSFVAPAHRSPTTACRKAEGLDVAAFLKGMKQRGHVLSDGYGKLKGQTFRVGHMGDHSVAELQSMLAAADATLRELRR